MENSRESLLVISASERWSMIRDYPPQRHHYYAVVIFCCGASFSPPLVLVLVFDSVSHTVRVLQFLIISSTVQTSIFSMSLTLAADAVQCKANQDVLDSHFVVMRASIIATYMKLTCQTWCLMNDTMPLFVNDVLFLSCSVGIFKF